MERNPKAQSWMISGTPVMVKWSKRGKGKTLYLEISIFPCGEADPTKNLTISCPDAETRFRITLSDYGLAKFRSCILGFYNKHVLDGQG